MHLYNLYNITIIYTQYTIYIIISNCLTYKHDYILLL